MHTADIIAEFLRLRADKGQLKSTRLRDFIHISATHMGAVMRGERSFPMKRLDETAEFFGTDAIGLIRLATEEIKKAGRFPPPLTEDEAERLGYLETRKHLEESDDEDDDDT